MAPTRRAIVGLEEHADQSALMNALKTAGATDVTRHSPSLPALIAVVPASAFDEFKKRAAQIPGVRYVELEGWSMTE
jgi:hypothetical protein